MGVFYSKGTRCPEKKMHLNAASLYAETKKSSDCFFTVVVLWAKRTLGPKKAGKKKR